MMQKILFNFGLYLFLSWGNFLPVYSIGIDWETSFMKVEFTPENLVVPTFSCFSYTDRNTEACLNYVGPKDHCVWENLDLLGFADDMPSPAISDCFQQAGYYTVSIQLYDYAQNAADLDVSNFTIFPQSPDQDTSILTIDSACTDESLTANGVDICSFGLQLRDQFGNPVTQLKNTTGKVYTNSDFINDANSGDLTLKDGFRLNNASIPNALETPLNFVLSNDDTVSYNFNLASWVPTMHQVGPHLGRTEAIPLDLHFKFPQIESDGTIDPLEVVDFGYGVYNFPVYFKPWAKSLITFDGVPDFILDVPTPMTLVRNLLLPIVGGPNSLISLYFKHHNLPEELIMEGVNLDPNPISITAQETNINPVIRVDLGDVPLVEDLSFSSKISYVINDGSGNKNIIYPSGAIGSNIPGGAGADDYTNTNIEVTAIGASIEGKMLGSSEETFLQDGETLRVGKNTFADVREEIFQNSIRLTRGISPKTDVSTITFDNNWFATESIVLVENQDVLINVAQLPTGKNTLIIKNGNLIVDGDFEYANNLDSFGFILINDVVSDFPEKANILVRADVKRMVGTYFGEGVFATIPVNAIDPVLSDVSNGNAGNITQLILEGALLTHNTLGGGFLRGGATLYKTPWGTTADATLAARYDLHYVRSYIPLYDLVDPYPQINLDKCVPGPGGVGVDCDTNRHAFVLRIDGKVTQLAPPGFHSMSFLKR